MGQQISAKAADTIWTRLVSGSQNKKSFLVYISNTKLEWARIQGLSQRKHEYIKSIAENIISNNDFVILYPNDINDMKWLKIILQYSDQILVLGNPKELTSIKKKERDIIGNYDITNTDKYWLVLNHDKDVITPENTKNIIALSNI